MMGKSKLAAAIAAVLWLALTPGYGRAQAAVRLSGTVSPAAAQIPNAAAAPAAMPMAITVMLALRNVDALEQLKRDQQNPTSPSYHKWLTTAQFNELFGPRQVDADAVAQWLSSAGFTVKAVDLNLRTVRATASAAVVGRALDVTIVSNGKLFANVDEPSVPAALAPLIANVEGLNNTFAVKPMATPEDLRLGSPSPTSDQPGATVSPEYKSTLGYAFSPSDLRTYYNENALISAGVAGTKAPDCIALAETSDVHSTTFGAFTSKFGLPAVKLTKVFASGHNPGFIPDAEIEADLDVEYSHAVAPNTPVKLYIGSGTSDLLDAINRAVSDNACGVISISFSYCGMSDMFYMTTLDGIFSQAATQGQTVFVSSGDTGAAGLVSNGRQCVPGTTPNVSEMAADPNVTTVGGTQFDPNYNPSNNKDTSLVTDTTDSPSAWNENVGATGGGISGLFDLPSYQTGAGISNETTKREIPDVALAAAVYSPGYYVVVHTGGKNQLATYGGTSLASPAWAGYSRLIAQIYGPGPIGRIGRLGLMNTQLYALGHTVTNSGLIDVTAGDNSFGFVTGYQAAAGYDMTTGWGSPDMPTLLVSYLAGGTATTTSVAPSEPPKTVVGDAGVLTLTNTSSSTVLVNSVTVNLTRPTIFKSVSMTAGSQKLTPFKSKKMVFKFNPPIAIAASDSVDFTLGATMTGIAQAGTPQSVQSIAALGVSATAGGDAGVTFMGLPASLGTITLTH
jgi:subtilase family serine protease